ncbi:hypothetical protein BK138_34020 [Paenibacillus rhizosphaerae]|uniref:N-acetyltransferase domain-containing protein n=1 Tax=Paenibacillus rhizosphaerae TaxID=297318 RepID=A0A1R1DZT9_9BACL|nr:hypothetical protein [Paenibacillus rhizosphaerae]OMF44992.1 hypothetical protein BK138_34020 [Paenibacillus rhizosphaerae]
MRLTYKQNALALKLYRGLGFDQWGEVNYPGRTASFPVFEKVFENRIIATVRIAWYDFDQPRTK